MSLAPLRILCCGSRDWRGRAVIHRALTLARGDREPKDITVVHGNYRGADKLCDAVARQLGYHVEPHDADWAAHGPAAGPIRNSLMVGLGADKCFSFGDGDGTRDCVKKAKQAGIPTWRFGLPDGDPEIAA